MSIELKNKRFVIYTSIITIIALPFLFPIAKELIYLKIFPSKVVYGKETNIVYGEDVDGDNVEYVIKYYDKYYVNSITRPSSDNYNLRMNDSVEVLVSNINPSIALYNHSSIFLHRSMILGFFLIFNVISVYIVYKPKSISWQTNDDDK